MRKRKPLPEPGRRDPAVARWWFGSICLAVACVLLDLFLIGMPLLGLSLFGPLAVGLVAQALFRWAGRRRGPALRSLLRALLLIVCGAVSFFTCQVQVAQGRAGAQAIGAALAAYHAQRGHYPAELDALVPDQMERLPTTGYRFGDAPYVYRLDADGQPWLGWTYHALGGWARYDFTTGLVHYD